MHDLFMLASIHRRHLVMRGRESRHKAIDGSARTLKQRLLPKNVLSRHLTTERSNLT